MWAVVVEAGAPFRHQIAGMGQAVEQVFVQAFISHPPIEAFYDAVLHWFSRRDVVPVDLAVFLPF